MYLLLIFYFWVGQKNQSSLTLLPSPLTGYSLLSDEQFDAEWTYSRVLDSNEYRNKLAEFGWSKKSIQSWRIFRQIHLKGNDNAEALTFTSYSLSLPLALLSLCLLLSLSLSVSLSFSPMFLYQTGAQTLLSLSREIYRAISWAASGWWGEGTIHNNLNSSDLALL